MSSPAFHQTMMGRKFLEGTIPNLSRAIEELSESIKEKEEITRRMVEMLEKSTLAEESSSFISKVDLLETQDCQSAFFVRAHSVICVGTREVVEEFDRVIMGATCEEEAVSRLLQAESYDEYDSSKNRVSGENG